MSLTKHRGLSDEELLQLLTERRNYSSIIEELCQRIERNIDRNFCPVCEANINAYLEDID